MAYVDVSSHGSDADQATNVVFLHGNPTSSFLWRDVMPPVLDGSRECNTPVRCLAPDLVGMGHSGGHPDPSSDSAFTFGDHAQFVDEWFDRVLDGKPCVLVLHDWGSALGFHWARRHAPRVQGIVHMESLVAPMTWDEFPEGGRSIFQAMRTPGAGEEIVLEVSIGGWCALTACRCTISVQPWRPSTLATEKCVRRAHPA